VQTLGSPDAGGLPSGALRVDHRARARGVSEEVWWVRARNGPDLGRTYTARLLRGPEIGRPCATIAPTTPDALAHLSMQDAGESLSDLACRRAEGTAIQNMGRLPSQTPVSEELPKALKEREFKSLVQVLAYARMQASGLVNSHATIASVATPSRGLVVADGPSPDAHVDPVGGQRVRSTPVSRARSRAPNEAEGDPTGRGLGS
jgi:hypothetical protein